MNSGKHQHIHTYSCIDSKFVYNMLRGSFLWCRVTYLERLWIFIYFLFLKLFILTEQFPSASPWIPGNCLSPPPPHFCEVLYKPHRSKITHYLSSCGWFVSFSLISIHLAGYGRFPAFLRLKHVSLCVRATFSLYGHLGCSYNLATVNNTAVNLTGPMSIWRLDFKSFEGILEIRVARSYGKLIFYFLSKLHAWQLKYNLVFRMNPEIEKEHKH